MWGEGDFKNVEVDDEGAGFDLEELFGSLYSMKSDGSFIAVPDAGVPIVVA